MMIYGDDGIKINILSTMFFWTQKAEITISINPALKHLNRIQLLMQFLKKNAIFGG
ncbi:hypothetical protein GCM10022277_06790 [Litoribacillus peritrichatus]|uniref:Uncharacterized protein n=1 Tax=Litoribacillus peritrichatus TaxID=718191 RepID=A0ABP7M551_9GAMM